MFHINGRNPKIQGHRRIFKSGPAEKTIGCQRHERGESTRGGPFPPLFRVVWDLPCDFCLDFEPLYVRFNQIFQFGSLISTFQHLECKIKFAVALCS